MFVPLLIAIVVARRNLDLLLQTSFTFLFEIVLVHFFFMLI